MGSVLLPFLVGSFCPRKKEGVIYPLAPAATLGPLYFGSGKPSSDPRPKKAYAEVPVSLDFGVFGDLMPADLFDYQQPALIRTGPVLDGDRPPFAGHAHA
jgi:hypothetical protein